MLERLRRLPALAYWALLVSFIGVAAEVTFHFFPPQAIPAFDTWFKNLSAIDRDFYSTSMELIAHFFIGLGLAGMITAIAQQQLSAHERDQNSNAPK
jgi:hypothetical protein